MHILLIGACLCYSVDVYEMEVQGVMKPSSVDTVGPPHTLRSEELLSVLIKLNVWLPAVMALL